MPPFAKEVSGQQRVNRVVGLAQAHECDDAAWLVQRRDFGPAVRQQTHVIGELDPAGKGRRPRRNAQYAKTGSNTARRASVGSSFIAKPVRLQPVHLTLAQSVGGEHRQHLARSRVDMKPSQDELTTHPIDPAAVPPASPPGVRPEAKPQTQASPPQLVLPREIGGRDGPEPTRFGDGEKAGRCIDF
jgi:hypothetical protein